MRGLDKFTLWRKAWKGGKFDEILTRNDSWRLCTDNL